MRAPTRNIDFDKAYRAPFTLWGDIRIPPELQALVGDVSPKTALELGCGIGRFSRYVAQQGVRVTGVDFSSVAIGKARERSARDAQRADFIVGDVTELTTLTGPYDVAFDVGCFHCFDTSGQRAYVGEVGRLLNPGATHLIWALDESPSDLALSPDSVRAVFAPTFELREARSSRRRLARSHWYWLTRR